MDQTDINVVSKMIKNHDDPHKWEQINNKEHAYIKISVINRVITYPNFKNIIKLNLSHSSISDDHIKLITDESNESFSKLQYVGLFDTNVTTHGLTMLGQSKKIGSIQDRIRFRPEGYACSYLTIKIHNFDRDNFQFVYDNFTIKVGNQERTDAKKVLRIKVRDTIYTEPTSPTYIKSRIHHETCNSIEDYSCTKFLTLLENLPKIMSKQEITKMCGYDGIHPCRDYHTLKTLKCKLGPRHNWYMLTLGLKQKGYKLQELL
jgi:hypothetical protein